MKRNTRIITGLLAGMLAGHAQAYTYSSTGCSSGCSYPLDASQSEIVAAGTGANAFPTTSPAAQQVSYTLAATGGSQVTYVASNEGAATALQSGTGNISLSGTGIIAFEMRIDSFPSQTLSLNGLIDAFMAVASGTNASYRFIAGVYGGQGQDGTASGVFSPTTGWSSNAHLAAAAVPTSGYRVGIYINKGTRQIGYTLNGVDQGYSADLIPASVSAISIVLSSDSILSSGDQVIGQKIGMTLITQSTQMTQPFPSGATDICGNTI